MLAALNNSPLLAFILTFLAYGLTACGQQPGPGGEPPERVQPRPLTIPYSKEQLRKATLQIANTLPDTALSEGLLPPDASKIVFDKPAGRYVQQRNWNPSTYHWAASEVWHYPLYFEDVMLERHGHARGPWVQPWVSGARFFGTFPAFAYKCQLDPPRTQISALGHYRPGNAVPSLWQRPRWRWDAAGVQAAATTGLIFIIP